MRFCTLAPSTTGFQTAPPIGVTNTVREASARIVNRSRLAVPLKTRLLVVPPASAKVKVLVMFVNEYSGPAPLLRKLPALGPVGV